MPSKPVGEGSEAENPGHEDLAAVAADAPAQAGEVQLPRETPGPNRPSTPTTQPEQRPENRSPRKKARIPIILTILGLALLGLSLKLLPSRNESPTPAYDQITVHSTVKISVIDY